jgi:putative pyruvate formate lyase activating enzyme
MSDPLSRYNAIVKGRMLPHYIRTKEVPVAFTSHISEDKLWRLHRNVVGGSTSSAYKEKISRITGSKNLLDLKLELSERMLKHCRSCEKRCGIDRSKKATGKCAVGPQPHIASHFLHQGEEKPLNPSYTVFFAGCNFNCAFCQNHDISTEAECGRYIPPEVLARRIEVLTEIGQAGFHVTLVHDWPVMAKNVNWVGGEPTPALHYVLQVLRETKANIPQIWNSNMYMSLESMELLDGIVDLYLADFKYGNDSCAARLSKVDRYLEVVSRNHLIASKQADLIVRHLMLPGHLECCTLPVLDWLAKNTPGAAVNLMDQYHPAHHALEYPELRTGVSKESYCEAKKYAIELGLKLI